MDRQLVVACGLAVALTACGGGGGGSNTPAVAAPSITISFAQLKASIGVADVLTWSTTNATTCVGQDNLTGSQPLSGTSSITPTVGGQFKYTVSCTGAGGTTSGTALLMVPLPVLASSYQNSAIAGEVLGSQALPSEVAAGNAVAFADFFQDGTYSMVTHSLEYNPSNPATSTTFGHIHFWQKIGGAWVDKTPSLLSNNLGCLHPRKAVVADFNHSGRPSIFFACHGFDASPFPGESPHLLLSQADGTYSNVTLPFTGFFHSASAADITGDGYPDVLVTDNIIEGKPYFLINKQNGTFAKSNTRLPTSVNFRPIFTAELIDFYNTGRFDAFLGGHEQSGSWPATILPNDGSGAFASTTAVRLPASTGYGFPTDIVFKAGNIYLARTIDLSSNFYGGAAIQKIAFPSLANQIIYQHSAAYSNGSTWINWIISNGSNIVSKDNVYGISVPQ